MTSKSSLFSLRFILENFKRFYGFMAIWGIVLFFALPVALATVCQNVVNNTYYADTSLNEYLKTSVNSILSVQNKSMFVFAMILAVITAIIVFSYINSKTQVDFYHSLPIRRSKLFVTNCIIGFLTFAVPFLICIGLATIVPGLFGVGEYVSMSMVFALIGYVLLFYIVVFLITLVAVMLCGNTFISILGTGVFFIVPMASATLFIYYMEKFFSTFNDAAYFRVFENTVFRNLSPVFDFINSDILLDFSAGRIFSYILFSIVIFFVSLLLYNSRSSESATKAIAFNLAKSIIKYALVFFFTALFGFAFWSIGNNNAWLIFGIICGAVLSHCILEIIYDFDFKSAKKNLKGLLVFMVAFALLFAIPAFDVFGYDKYLPEKEKIISVSLDLPYVSYSSYTNIYRGYDIERYEQFKLTTKENIDRAYQIAQMSINTAPIDQNADNRYNYNQEFPIAFTLAGNTSYRKYGNLEYDQVKQIIFEIYDSSEFKQTYYELIANKEKFSSYEKIYTIYENTYTRNPKTIYNKEQTLSLIDAICADIMTVKAEFIEKNVPIATISFNYDNDYPPMQMPVYSNCTQTLALLNELGADTKAEFSADEISYIEIFSTVSEKYDYYNSEKYGYDKPTTVKTEYAETTSVKITDQKQIKELLSVMVPSSSYSDTLFFDKSSENPITDKRFTVAVYPISAYSYDFLFLNEKTPPFVLEQFGM